MFGWCGTPETATARPPRNGPMQRQRISEKSFWSNGWRTFWSSCCASATVQKKVQKEIQRIVAPTIPLLHHLPARPIRIRVLRKKGEDTLAAKSEQCAEARSRSEEHTSELQSHHDLVCRLLLEKKKKKQNNKH